MPRRAGKTFLTSVLIGVALLGSASASFAATQTLKLYFVHTGEKASITFKRNGIYDPRGLAQVNRFLRDWRKNEPAKMDPELLDLIWEVHKRSGSRDYIHIVSGYRSPDTNNMLRSRSANTGVAKRSQHTLGKAMDFYIPGVNLSTLRAIGMQMQIGGVGFYPTSGSPFVHMDVGNVRAWPRMSRQELAKIFPDGRTLHRPADGRPLPGYNQALAAARQKSGTGVANPGADDDSDVVSPGSDNSLLTAMLPVPKTRPLADAGRKPAIGVADPTADEDGDVVSTGSGDSLLTAMLPVPKTRAQAMFDNQLGRGNPLDDDLALQMVPLPTLRPPQIKVAAVEVGNRGRPTAEAEKSVPRVPRVFFTEPLTSIASLPMHGAVARSAQRFRGHGAFATQSIRPSAQATTASLATFERRPQEEAAITGTIAPRTGSAEFDAGRFSSEG
ncbi:DUF882 domain-containing protein [Rhizobium tumorigenes]|uniref:Murein endopeptidase K n=1 Tax=Rhizobium tumorigenes TaxID=2041385 RepID=A0AAF1KTE0_9HYPH|nr:DUF882 domain-containing protein [Rhizobium tumorigenes]WFR98826.1 DUF882 domain-containing protein [Rhizobium tumorigenes]